MEKERTKELEALEENEVEDESAEVDSVISRIEEEDDDEKMKKVRIIEKRNEMLEEWEFPAIIGRIQKCDDLVLELINVNHFF